jgi:hypothetical protein
MKVFQSASEFIFANLVRIPALLRRISIVPVKEMAGMEIETLPALYLIVIVLSQRRRKSFKISS